jgi:uncharacterized protein
MDGSMNSKEVVIALYEAYAARSEERIAALLDKSVIWMAPAGNATQVALGLGRSEDAGAPRGLNDLNYDDIVRFMTQDFHRFFLRARNEFQLILADGNFVVVAHRLSSDLPNGRTYMNDYCFIYEVKNEKVCPIREYMDTRGGWLQIFGDAEPSLLVQ